MYITHNCICCYEESVFYFEIEEDLQSKILHKKDFKCCKCNLEYLLLILEGYSSFNDVIYSVDQNINLDAEKLLYFKYNHIDKMIEVAFKIGEYDRGIMDEIAISKIIDSEFEYINKINSYRNPESVHKGNRGENEFKKYLEEHEINFIFIDQHYNTLSEHYNERVKRPDYLINNNSNFFVDVKNYKLDSDHFNLNKMEFNKLKEFQEIFNLDIYFIFYKLNEFDIFYLIKLSNIDSSISDKFDNIIIYINNMKKVLKNENLLKIECL